MSQRIPTEAEAEVLARLATGDSRLPNEQHGWEAWQAAKAEGWMRWSMRAGYAVAPAGRAALARAKEAGVIA